MSHLCFFTFLVFYINFCLISVFSSLYSLSDCGVTDKDCAALTSVLRSNPSQLIDLDLSDKAIRDSGVKLLSVVLEDPRCKLEILQ